MTTSTTLTPSGATATPIKYFDRGCCEPYQVELVGSDPQGNLVRAGVTKPTPISADLVNLPLIVARIG